MTQRVTKKATIFYARKLARKTQEAYAADLGIHRVTLAYLETYRDRPTEGLLPILAHATGRTEEEIREEYRHVKPRDRRPLRRSA